MRSTKLFATTVFAAAAVAASPATAAVNVGDTVSCAVTGGGSFTCSQASATIASGNEFTVGSSAQYLGVNFDQNSLQITALLGASLGATILNFRDLTNAFTSVALTTNNGFSGYSAGNATVTNGNLQIDLRGTSFASGATLRYSVAAVPEPATWALMILGMGAVGFAMRRRSKVNTTVRFA
ncbi:FxDxF family PEP-CTERM protein [Sphingomonas sp. MA1305]|uniref:FxDxF family PEP-CTERM protein n=1 Tax=Sphingomonas sp. MA1305 TaxID=2479204 RepID=UPI001E3A8DC1|nr:FxDxF family PEP-CTERM protein [Sphingomonas sp. MA1305]